ncbi:Oleoyl-acyl carrier chloroplastic [Micractinium conductrix]|uniref:Acyl-[acyl-carrier-protein] hydrolase n=1 Tax=Micractinium conductrix TaxID=554055 RepID=A0A2P6V5S5_9CHLO|nr:Oleoyl-acyl carrier chloroplastic [Micractinium conductrix]|eukprot:PSC69441.1 Oleoyl-acyl carrier chloroplastic [Micractinium conductrix]
MIGKFGDFDTEGKKIYVDHMAGLVDQLKVVLTRIKLSNDELGNEMLRMQNVQMLSANTNMQMIMEGLEQEMAEMRRVIALEEATTDPATLAAIKAAWQERFKYAANLRVDKLASDPQAMRGSLDPQALKAAQDVSADPRKIDQYRDNPDLYAFLEFPAPPGSSLVEDNRAFVECHRIRGNEVGPNQHTNIISIATLLQEAASNHAVAMWGRSTEGFASDPAMGGLIFVMTRMQLQMERYPRWGDLVEVKTWFQEDGKLAAQRDFVITDVTTGQPLGRATSTWVMINMQTRRLSKFPEAAKQKMEAFQQRPPRHAIAREQTRQKLPDLGLPAEIVGPIQVARRSDMDMNGHVNNVTYLAWALETVPSNIYSDCHLYQMEIDYKAECLGGDLVESLAGHCGTHESLLSNGAGPDALSFVHVLRRCNGEACTELVRARTAWRAGEPPVDAASE